jgi:hypothetical protein
MYLSLRISGENIIFESYRLWFAEILSIETKLTIEIILLDPIVIDENKLLDASTD